MSTNANINTLDRKILNALSRDARASNVEIAHECGTSAATVTMRIAKMQNLGVLQGYSVRLDYTKLGVGVCAFIGVYLDNSTPHGDVIAKLEELAEVVECHYTTGIYSVFAKCYCNDNGHLQQVFNDDIAAIAGVARVETLVSLEESFSRPLPLGEE